MSDKEHVLECLRCYNKSLEEDSTEAFAEAVMRPVIKKREAARDIDAEFQAESIILRRFRPVLSIKKNTTELEFNEEEDRALWEDKLKTAKANIDKAVRAVGRINLANGPMSWIGTGWLIADDIIVTNRHVAEIFSDKRHDTFMFKTQGGRTMMPDIDFLQEFDSSDTLAYKLLSPLYMSPPGRPDIAFFKVKSESGGNILAAPITTAGNPRKSSNVATIGYPAFDSRIPNLALMEEIYGRKYNKKRLAPGAVTNLQGGRVWHNCTTLGGASGSPVIDLDTGEALGLHYSGSFLRTNYAVSSDIVAEALSKVLRGEDPFPEARPQIHLPVPGGGTSVTLPSGSGASTSITVPLTISISLGDATVGSQAPGPHANRFPLGNLDDDDELDLDSEARIEDYADREGYQADFLGDDEFTCPLPQIIEKIDDVLTYDIGDGETSELPYEHFSVVMNEPRRMCFFSAVNINGAEYKKEKRKGWRLDPRIDEKHQIIKECYGNPPKFSRGHMTRRNDPSWGPTSQKANQDSMHVTNATPQMQTFNAPVWLELEDYALENAREDDMKISVFTGPYLCQSDPVFFGVKVPVKFWKVIAFIHDDTGELCATGYELDQSQSLPTEDEFVFGAFTSTKLGVAAQLPIRDIEAKAGISFSGLALRDPLDAETESIFGPRPATPLISRKQIRFI